MKNVKQAGVHTFVIRANQDKIGADKTKAKQTKFERIEIKVFGLKKSKDLGPEQEGCFFPHVSLFLAILLNGYFSQLAALEGRWAFVLGYQAHAS